MATDITRKKPNFGNSRSHAENATRRKQKVNKQKMTINGEKVIVSTREAKTLNKKTKKTA